MARLSSFSKYSRRRRPDGLTGAWLSLVALSLVSALLTMIPGLAVLAGLGILMLALLKARVILVTYLDLAGCPAALRGFTLGLTAFTLLVGGLYLL